MMQRELNIHKYYIFIIMYFVSIPFLFGTDKIDKKLYEMGLDSIQSDYKANIGDLKYNYFYILEDYSDVKLQEVLQESRSYLIKKFSKSLASQVKNNKQLANHISEELQFSYSSRLISDVEMKKYLFPNRSTIEYDYVKFFKENQWGAFIGLPKIVYNKAHNKAAFFAYFFNPEGGGYTYLVTCQLKDKRWQIHKVKFVLPLD